MTYATGATGIGCLLAAGGLAVLAAVDVTHASDVNSVGSGHVNRCVANRSRVRAAHGFAQAQGWFPPCHATRWHRILFHSSWHAVAPRLCAGTGTAGWSSGSRRIDLPPLQRLDASDITKCSNRPLVCAHWPGGWVLGRKAPLGAALGRVAARHRMTSSLSSWVDFILVLTQL